MLIEKKAITGIECKLAVEVSSETTTAMAFTGYGSVFDNVDFHGDIVEPGAFTNSLNKHKGAGTFPLMCLNHNVFDALPIGRWTSIEEDEYGLKVTGELLDTTAGRDTYTALKAGAIKGLSIGFYPVKWAMATGADDYSRTISEVDLLEISVVTIAANELAQVNEVKSSLADMSIRDLERLLREQGLSRKQAETVASQFESKKYIAEQKRKQEDDAALQLRIKRLLAK
ncbi:HK97 family phage prohead protease [Sphingobium sp. LMC3-1-1.1]|uniref:HK97 family phage prohead protease n=1 Tax=Sphingobium sp. LMC3-1-1.1 TaxID=3135241 RepID=UPI0034213501